MKRGRKKGEKPLYSAQQTKRYKSMQARYEKSLNINPDSVQEIDGKQTYIFLSKNSPTGKWEVTSGSDSDIIANFSAQVAWNSTEGDNGINYSPAKNSSLDNINASFQGSGTLNNAGLPFPKVRMIRGGISSSVEIAIGEDVLIESIKYKFSWALSIGLIGGAIANKSPVYRALIDVAFNVTDESSGSREADRSLLGGQTLTFLITVEQEILALGAGAGVEVSVSQTLEILEVNGEPVEGDYICTCPDFSKKIDSFANRKFNTESEIYESQLEARNWESSEAGTPEYCKHILSVMRYRGEEIPKYLDLPE